MLPFLEIFFDDMAFINMLLSLRCPPLCYKDSHYLLSWCLTSLLFITFLYNLDKENLIGCLENMGKDSHKTAVPRIWLKTLVIKWPPIESGLRKSKWPPQPLCTTSSWICDWRLFLNIKVKNQTCREFLNCLNQRKMSVLEQFQTQAVVLKNCLQR